MKLRIVQQELIKPLVSRIPNLESGSSFFYIAPLGRFLRGFAFQASRWNPAGFYFTWLIQPLYVPAEHLCGIVGDRLEPKRKLSWSAERLDDTLSELESLVRRQLTWKWAKVDSPAKLIEILRTRRDPADPYVVQAIAYSRILMKKFAQARRDLQRLIDGLLEDPVAWGDPLIKRARLLIKDIDQLPERALRRLGQYERESRETLRLPAAEEI